MINIDKRHIILLMIKIIFNDKIIYTLDEFINRNIIDNLFGCYKGNYVAPLL